LKKLNHGAPNYDEVSASRLAKTPWKMGNRQFLEFPTGLGRKRK
jgi:hypothetical protein